MFKLVVNQSCRWKKMTQSSLSCHFWSQLVVSEPLTRVLSQVDSNYIMAVVMYLVLFFSLICLWLTFVFTFLWYLLGQALFRCWIFMLSLTIFGFYSFVGNRVYMRCVCRLQVGDNYLFSIPSLDFFIIKV